jgi:hypothetical protein
MAAAKRHTIAFVKRLTGGLLELASPYDRNEVHLAVKLYELPAELVLNAETIGTTISVHG